jgi:hypothetical protein
MNLEIIKLEVLGSKEREFNSTEKSTDFLFSLEYFFNFFFNLSKNLKFSHRLLATKQKNTFYEEYITPNEKILKYLELSYV